jgi:hypothetical protein
MSGVEIVGAAESDAFSDAAGMGEVCLLRVHDGYWARSCLCEILYDSVTSEGPVTGEEQQNQNENNACRQPACRQPSLALAPRR